jgi:hypothetical protein
MILKIPQEHTWKNVSSVGEKFITFVLSQDKYSDLHQLCVNLNKDAPIFCTETMLFGKVSGEFFEVRNCGKSRLNI